MLAVPQAFVVTQGPAGEGVPEVTGNVEDISQLDGYSTDNGSAESVAESVGEDVEVGGISQTCAVSTSTPTTTPTTKPTTVTPTKPAKRSTTTKARISQHTVGKGVEVEVKLPAKVKSFYFHWELGVTFGRERIKLRFVTTKLAPSDFTFRLDPGVLWLSARRRAYLNAHHSKTATGVFEVRTVTGTLYREAVKVTL